MITTVGRFERVRAWGCFGQERNIYSIGFQQRIAEVKLDGKNESVMERAALYTRRSYSHRHHTSSCSGPPRYISGPLNLGFLGENVFTNKKIEASLK